MSSTQKILVIDDEQPVSRALSHKLTAAGYEVAVANNADDGLGKITDLEPDLVILDLIMPDVDGFDVLGEIDADEIPIFVFSNLSEAEDKQRVEELGAEKFLVKSEVQLSDVIEEVDKFFS